MQFFGRMKQPLRLLNRPRNLKQLVENRLTAAIASAYMSEEILRSFPFFEVLRQRSVAKGLDAHADLAGAIVDRLA